MLGIQMLSSLHSGRVYTSSNFMVFNTMQVLVSSLEKKIDETEKKYEETNKVSEERLKQALEAESKIILLKTTMQRFLVLTNNLRAPFSRLTNLLTA